ncbi:hypothetical protein GA0061099_10425 [Bradyrhizobium yuanmingense]|uniref:Uncharacterized protein n=1 Tax=Bradyrhizobium yuanmingense TaxID=108015 RepID=A0A1C3XKT1_9BRAD|nr:hypothetical protein IQ15_07653 [Bradyrhizobium yuanmingense]SCB52877.1 hypothetical protein GA0061099_10425 [Bradyrhizobium yuanmingense]
MMPYPRSINDVCRAIYRIEQRLQGFELPRCDAAINLTFYRLPPILEVSIDGSSVRAINII